MAVENALLYKRVSTAKQEEEGTSLKTQEDRMRAYCAEHGYGVAAVFEDSHSGSDMDRPGLRALRTAVRAGQGDVVLAYALDRLSRSQSHQAVLLYEFKEEKGLRVEFVTEQLDDTPVGRFLLQGIGFAAELEREKIAERNSRGLRERAEAGKIKVGGKPLYGYQWADPDLRAGAKWAYLPDPATAPVVQRIFRDIAGGATLLSLARTLSAEGIPTPTAQHPGKTRRWRAAPLWGRSTIAYLIRNPAYKGEHAAYRNKVVKRRVRNQFTGETRRAKIVLRGAGDALPLPASACPPLVDHETWQAANNRLALNKQFATRNNRMPEAALLRGGFARCGYCGSLLTVIRSHDRTYYRCRRLSSEAGPCEGRCMAVPAAILDTAVWEAVSSALLDPENLRRIMVQAFLASDGVSETEQEARTTQAVLTRLKAKHRALIDSLATATSDYHREVLNQAADEAARHIEAQQLRLAELQSAAQGVQQRRHDLLALLDQVDQWEVASQFLTYQDRRTILYIANAQVRVWRTEKRGRGASDQSRWEITHDLTPERIKNSIHSSR